MFVSTFTGAVYVVQLHFNFISVKGTVTSSQSAKFYASLWDNVVYVSAHYDNVEGYINVPLIMTMVARLRR